MGIVLPSVLTLVLCVWRASGAKTCQIEATLMDSNTLAKVNSSYFFGIYGTGSLQDPVSGQLVHVRSGENANHGCDEYTHDLPDHDWVALIERGQCYFTDKIRRATKQYNASAVIIYDNAETTTLVSIQSLVQDEVYLYTKQSYGRRLAELTDSGMHVHVTIIPVSSSASALAVTAAIHVLCVSLLLRLGHFF